MRCHEKFAGERCSLRGEHKSLHVSKNGRVIWGEWEDEEPGGTVSNIVREDDPDEVIVIDSAIQCWEPIPHVLVEKRIVRRSCPYCQGTGVAYDPKTAEGPKCPFCKRQELPS